MTARALMLALISILVLSSMPILSPNVESTTIDVPLDTGPPRISNVSMSGSYTTGDAVTISVDVSDDINVSSVWLVHNWSVSQPSSVRNVSFMRAGDLFSITILNPINTTSPIWYMVKANDTSNNWNTTGWYSHNISDNDPPIFLFDGSTANAYTGEAFGFVTNMDDNIGIFRASINFTIENGINYNFSMCGAGNSRQTLILIPVAAQGTLEYFFWFTDDAGNEGTSSNFSRFIVDITPPYLIQDYTVGPVNSSEILEIHLQVMDNWDIHEAWLDYELEGWYQPPSRVPFVIPLDGNFTIGFAVPGNFSGNFTYNATFMDGSLNVLRTENRTILVNDGTRPELIADLTDRITTTGEELIFGFRVKDNIEVSEVTVTYKLPDEDWFTSYTSYFEQWESWRYDLDVPENVEGEGQYFAKIIDSSGNFHIGEIGTFYIFDNDDPVILFDETDAKAETGQNFTFKIAAKDNIGVTSAIVDYSMMDETYQIELLRSDRISDGYFHEGTIQIPYHAVGNLTYSIEVEDERGNQIVISGSVEIVDSILPEIVSVRFIDESSGESVTSLSTGDMFTIEVNISDNVDPSKVEFYYVLPDEMDRVYVLLKRGLKFNTTRTFTQMFVLPYDKQGYMEIEVIATDANDVDNISYSSKVYIRDNDPPELISIDHPTEIGIFSFINITLEAVDNFKIRSANVFYGRDELVWELRIPMETEDDRTFTLSEPVVLGSIETLTVTIMISDGKQSLYHSFNITIIDDIGPEVTFTAPATKIHPDDQSTLVKMVVFDMSDWEIVTIAMVQGETGFEVINLTIYGDFIEFYFTPTGPGDWEVQVHLKDNNDMHSISKLDLYIIDRTPPYFQIVLPTDEIEWNDQIKLEFEDYQDSSELRSVHWTIMGPDGEKRSFDNNSIEFEPWGSGEYRIDLVIEDEFGNSNEKTKWITVKQKPDDDHSNLPLIILIILTLIIGGLVLWLSVKDKLPEKFKNWKQR